MPTNLNPRSQTSPVVLTQTGSSTAVAAAVPFGMYTGSAEFLNGAAVQVAYTYKKLGGDVVDIELTPANVYAAYEEAVLEYSYIVNLHQSKNMLSDVLGNATGTFDHRGEIADCTLSSSLGGDKVALKYPRFQFEYARRIGDGMSAVAALEELYLSILLLSGPLQIFKIMTYRVLFQVPRPREKMTQGTQLYLKERLKGSALL